VETKGGISLVKEMDGKIKNKRAKEWKNLILVMGFLVLSFIEMPGCNGLQYSAR
jgi:hypothetical protein